MPPLVILQPYIQAQQTYISQHSLRFNSNDASYMSKVFAPSGTTATFSFWIKRTDLGTTQSPFGWSNGVNNSFNISFTASDQLDFSSYLSTYNARKLTTRVFRDVSSWYHIVCVVDTTNATAADRMRVYVNGARETSFSASVDPSQNLSTALSSNVTWGIGGTTGMNINYVNGYLSEFNFVDGQALTPTSFGVTDFATGQWKPITYAGTYGTNGFYLPFNDGTSTTTLGYDRSGNTNNWTLSNFSIVPGVNNDWLSDTPTNNFCILNAIDKNPTTTAVNGGLEVTNTGSSVQQLIRGTIGVATGQWYWEVATAVNNGIYVGIATSTCSLTAASAKSIYINQGGQVYVDNNSTVVTTLPSAYALGDVYGVAVDLDGGSISWYKNGILNGSYSFTPGGQLWMPLIGNYYVSSKNIINFGQRAFVYTAPTGFKSLSTNNLPTPTIVNGNNHFDVSTWVGTGATKSITGLNFQPDFVWSKLRSTTSGHNLVDSVRGSTNEVYSNLTNTETAEPAGCTSFDSTGYTIGSGSGWNLSGSSVVGWSWKANGPAVTNTDGIITSQISANTTAGFSIVTFTGNGATSTTVGHGLGAVPKFYFIKPRNATGGVAMVHTIVDGTVDYMFLNATAANGNATQTPPTSTVFNVRADAAENTLGRTNIVYAFAEVQGYSKINKYNGNGSVDGPFVYCGFKPKFLLVKRSDAVGNWYIYDTARDTYNQVGLELYPNLSNAEANNVRGFDILSNGFKARTTSAETNATGGTYIFLAIAETPFVYSSAR